MHVENKSIIITDPCYIMNHDNSPKHPNPLDYGVTDPNIGTKPFDKYSTPEELAYKKALDEYYDKLDREERDWDRCDYGGNMEALGITNYICRDTLYGDWSCTTYNTDTKEAIGHFCADAGLVAVFELDEVLKYNPKFDYHKERPWTTTLIENFTGDIHFEVVHQSGVYTKEDEFESNGRIYCKEGETWEEDEVRVIGVGNVNFFTTQTGL